MTHRPFLLAMALLAIVGVNEASAQPKQVFVAAQGLDGNPCTVAQPCRTFQHAHDTVAAGGEIDVLNAADYGPITITKALSIINGGVGAATIFASSGYAINIQAGQSDAVFIKGLTLDGAGTGSVGIFLGSGGTLTVTNCLARNFTVDGIRLQPSSANKFSIIDTISSDNGNSGIGVYPGLRVGIGGMIKGAQLTNNNSGIRVQGNGGLVVVTVVDTVAANNTALGFQVISAPPGAILALRNVTASNVSIFGTTVGIQADNQGLVVLGHSLVIGNGTGVLVNSGGFVETYGDNDINRNGTIVSGSMTPISMQ
jgi:hypothetical protein